MYTKQMWDENYKTIITAIKKIRKLALKDTEPTSILELPESGLHKSVQEIQSPHHIEASQVMTARTLPNTLVAGQQSVNFQNTVTVTHNTPKVTPFSPMLIYASGARALSQSTLPTLHQPAPVYGSIQDASRTSLSTYSATPQFSQFDPSMMKIRRRLVGFPPSRPMITPHSSPSRLKQEIQCPQHPPTIIAPITAPEPKSSVKSGNPDKSGKKPKRSREARPLGPANAPSNPGNAAPKPPVVPQLIGNKGMLPASLHIQRPDHGMYQPTLQGIPIGSSQHTAPQPSSTPYQYAPVSHPLSTNHPMAQTTAAMSIQVKPQKKVAQPPKII